MSKKSKAISKQNNLNKKRAQKMANRAKYAAWARAGENTKSTRAVRKKKKSRKNPYKGMHLIPHCGNPGCRRCFVITDTGVYVIKKN